MAEKTKKVGLFGLIAMVFGSMIGGGIFNLPQNMANHSALGPVIIAWIITGVGMLFLALTFKTLSDVRPDIKTGIYAYAKEGFGRYVGFNTAWGYWISSAVGNVAFAVMLNDALGYFWPVLHHHGWQTMIFGTVVIWIMNFIVLNGIKSSTSINTVTTVAKIVALIVIVVIMVVFFNMESFSFDFWGKSLDIGTIGEQVKSPMLITLWCFIGIEGAVVISGRAKKPSDVGKATVIGFLLALGLYILISLLAYGMMHQPQLAKLEDPSAGYLLQGAVGNWGIDLVNLAVIVSVGGAWVAWTIIVAEVPYAAAKEGVFPKIFSRENNKKAPDAALYITSLLMTIMMAVVVSANNVYIFAVDTAGVMILPAYILSAGFLWKESGNSKILKGKRQQRKKALIIGIFATVYSAWLIFAAGPGYILLSILFYTIGIPVFYNMHKQDIKQGKQVFKGFEKIIALVFILAAITAVYLLVTGKISY